ncbi:nickel-dependent hydrogenase large subunit [Candidatus Bathyarchaeota archaeon]|nr:nickel-dependent hydrogenase large subunit [Candidatus Bathyarchaeota archaeon]MBS7630018.1 nickel-dependent hydrogenase large subunit [Candidatus Bathyarchaeota archaeon]
MSEPVIEPEIMRISWGPQHPMSGQTRIIIDTDGEVIHKIIADIGFTHRGIEKVLENRTFLKGIVPIERMVMVDTANIGLGYVTAIEKAFEIDVPERAQWIRSLICEMSRINSHLYAFGLQAESTGYFPAVFLWTTVDREVILDLFEKLTGARWSFNFFIPGGVVKDLPDGFQKEVLEAVKYLRSRFEQYWDAMVENALFEMRCKGVGVLTKNDAIRLGATGPVLRGSDVDIDVRKDQPYAAYGDLDFKVITETEGDVMARTKVRYHEIGQSLNIMEQVANEIPAGPVRVNFPLFPRSKVGEAFSRVETSRGELGIHMVTDGGMNPYRVKINSPTLRNVHVFERLAELDRILVADLPVVINSIDPWYLDCDR